MKPYEFTVILEREPSEDEADRLYGIIDDGTIATLIGVPQVSFHREAQSLEKALRSAMTDLQTGGFRAMRIECDPADIGRKS